jgi:putative spermidine/putrescine transport system substrate-binding protein
MTPPPTNRLPVTRRDVLKLAGAAAATLGVPGLARAQTKELVIGGAASHKAFMEPSVIPMFEKTHRCKIIFEGTKSLTNLEKMVSNRAKPYLSIVMMDDPVLLLATKEDVIEKITTARVPNLSKLKAGAVHMDGMWVNYQQPYTGVAYGTSKLKDGVASWAELWDGKYRGKIILPSLQNTEGLTNLFVAAHLETGKPLKEAQYQPDAAFKKLKALKPNLLTIYTQMPQAFNLLEQGEAWMIGGALSSYAMERKRQGAPIDLAAPKEGIMAMPSGIAKVKNGPEPELSYPSSTRGPRHPSSSISSGPPRACAAPSSARTATRSWSRRRRDGCALPARSRWARPCWWQCGRST